MHIRRLGRSGIRVSAIGVGTTQLRRVPAKQAVATLVRAFEAGINHVNTAPDYEGADTLVGEALSAFGDRDRVHVSLQLGGNRPDVEQQFESACKRLGTDRISLCGLAAVAEQEAFGFDVWGPRGTVAYLTELRAQGRIGALLASEHGTPEQMLALLERDVFDVLMVAHNPLGFHLITFRPETVWQLEQPPVPLQKPYGFEDLRRTATEVLPAARARDVGVLAMKVLAGGLLCAGRAFPGHPYREQLPPVPGADDVLAAALADPAVDAIVVGMASVEEVEQNARVLRSSSAHCAACREQVAAQAADLRQVLCSRCGHCDDLCRHRLPVSFLFRAAYHALYPTAPYEVSGNLQYFRLLADDELPCDTCTAPTCGCPAGIDIPRELRAIHRKMLVLRDAGAVADRNDRREDWITGRPLAAKLVTREIPARARDDARPVLRCQVRNTGTLTWHAPDTGPRPELVVSLPGRLRARARLRHDVPPTGQCHFAVELPTARRGLHELRVDLVFPGRRFRRRSRLTLLRQGVEVS